MPWWVGESEWAGGTVVTGHNRAACSIPLQSVLPAQASGIWEHMNGRDAHMLLQNELFLNVATRDFEEGELRGQISSLLYNGLLARYRGTALQSTLGTEPWDERSGGRGCARGPFSSGTSWVEVVVRET